MLIDTCSKSIIVFEFTINQSYIAKNLCVKRQQKVNTCNGKSHLKKELQSDEQREQSLPSSASLKYETLAFSSDIVNYTFLKAPAEKYFDHFLVKDVVDRSFDLLRPPSC